MSFFLVFQKLYKGTPGFEQGPPLGMQLHDLPSSYIPAAYRFNNITANTCRLFEHCYIIFCSESSVLSRSMSVFSSLSKIIQRDTRAQTRDLSDCSRILYHWAISPLHTDSITSLQIRSGCSSTVTMFFVPSQVYSRDQCNFFSSLSKIIQGDTRVRTRDHSDCSRMIYPELYPRCIQIQYHHCKHVQVVWALLQYFLFRFKCTLAIDVIFP